MVKIVECPRDAWQGLPRLIPAQTKTGYLRMLIEAGFAHLDAASFVSPAAVPQMADSEAVVAGLGSLEAVEIIAIVVNARGAERAVSTGAVHTLGFPYSISAGFLNRNQHQTPEQSIEALRAVAKIGCERGLALVAYVSMAFGNPYGEAWEARQVLEACERLVECGVTQISLADTVGRASPEQITEVFRQLSPLGGQLELGVHLHATPGDAPALVRAAYEAGCRRFDAAMGGLGGCPFAQDALVGNVPTELLLRTLEALGAELPRIGSLDPLLAANAEIARQFGA